MGSVMSDHQESELFAYDKTWEDIENMLDKAERVRNNWESKFHLLKHTSRKKEKIECLRNMKALEGVIKTLRWALGDKNVSTCLE